MFCLIVTGIFSGLYLYFPIDEAEQNRGNYLLAATDKILALKKLSGRRIIFTGGSSVAFGIDSKTVGDSLGYQGFNLGLHISVGPEFMVNQAMALAKSGDVVVISAEYFIPNGDPIMLNFLHAHCPETHGFLQSSQQESLQLSYKIWTEKLLQKTERIQLVWTRGIQAAIKKDTTSLFKRFGFNDHGDYVYHLNQ